VGNKKFDIIVFADVLEHLYDPVSILNFYKQFLNESGVIYVSVPNIAIWYARIGLLFGNFTYRLTGTFDKTHIRFFTRNNIRLLAKHTDLTIEKLDITPGIFRFFVPLVKNFMKKKNSNKKSSLMKSGMYIFYTKYIYPIEYAVCRIIPGLLAFQYIIVLKEKKS